MVADAVRFQEHIITVHRHRVRYARGAASGNGDHLAIGQGHGDGVVRGHRLAGGVHQAGRVGDGATVFGGRRGGCQLHGHRVGVVLHLGRGGAAGVQRFVIAAFGLGDFELLALCALQVAIVRAGVSEHRACELAYLDGDGFAGLERDDQIRALGRLVHRGGDRDLAALGHLCIGAEHDLGGVLVVHHIGAGGAGGIQTVVAAARGGTDFKEMLVRTLHVGIVRTGGNLHRARGFADPDDDDFAGPERDDQIAPAGCTVHGGGHDDHATFRHLLLCAQGQCAFVQRRQRGAGRTAQAVFHHVACGTGVSQRQRRCGFQHAGQTHKGVVTTTTTGIGCGSGIQLGQGILAVVDGGNQVLHQRIDRSGHGGLRGRNVFEHIRAQGHILVLAQDQRWLPVGLQHHGAARSGHDLRIGGNAHTLAQRREIAIRITNPGLACQLCHQHGSTCHLSLSISSRNCREYLVRWRLNMRNPREIPLQSLLAPTPMPHLLCSSKCQALCEMHVKGIAAKIQWAHEKSPSHSKTSKPALRRCKQRLRSTPSEWPGALDKDQRQCGQPAQ